MVPGNTKTISRIAEESQTYLDSLQADERASLDVKLEAAKGYKRLADILGNPDIANLGERDETGEMLAVALSSAEDLNADFPESAEAKRTLAEILFANSTHAYVAMDDNPAAHGFAVRASKIYEDIIASPDGNLMSGVPLPFIGRDAEGLNILLETHAAAQKLRSDFPDNIQALNFLGSINIEVARAMGRIEGNTGVAYDNLPYWNDGIALRHEAYETNPDDIRPYRSLVTLYYGRNAVHRSLENFDASLEDLKAAEEIGLEMLEKDPGDAWLERQLSGIRDERPRTLSYAGRHSEAVIASDLAMRLIRESESQSQSQSTNPGLTREWVDKNISISNLEILEDRCS